MRFYEILLIGAGLSMDALAVSLVKGLAMGRFHPRRAAVIALFFGAFQALMPLAGCLLGSRFASHIGKFDYLVSFALLAFVGGKMIWDALRGGEEDAAAKDDKLDIKELFLLAIATSIDALAVGIAFSFQQVDIVPAAVAIGVTTFLICFAGVAAGCRFGARYEKKAPLLGGIVLILIGIKIVLSHFGILPF